MNSKEFEDAAKLCETFEVESISLHNSERSLGDAPRVNFIKTFQESCTVWQTSDPSNLKENSTGSWKENPTENPANSQSDRKPLTLHSR